MRRKLLAIAGYIAASLTIPLAGLVMGLGFAVVVAIYIIITGLAKGDLTPGHLSLAMLPLYYGALGLVRAVPSLPGVILAFPFVVAGGVKGIGTIAYYGMVGGGDRDHRLLRNGR